MIDEPIDDAIVSDSEPASERITVALCEAIAQIAKLTGYWDDVIVGRPDPANPTPLRHARVEVHLNTEEPAEDVPSCIEQIDATYLLVCDVIAPESSKAKVDTLLNRLRADVKKAVCKDRTLGGLAMDTVFGAAQLQAIDETSYTGRVLVVCTVTYRTHEDDPYQLHNNPA